MVNPIRSKAKQKRAAKLKADKQAERCGKECLRRWTSWAMEVPIAPGAENAHMYTKVMHNMQAVDFSWVVWCTICGSYSDRVLKNLAETCPTMLGKSVLRARGRMHQAAGHSRDRSLRLQFCVAGLGAPGENPLRGEAKAAELVVRTWLLALAVVLVCVRCPEKTR